MNSQQGLGSRDRDIDDFIRQEKDNPNFQNMFKKIMEGGTTTKKVENFLVGNQMTAMHDYQSDPELYKTAKEIYEQPGYDPASKREAKRQLDLMDAGLPRFPKV
jgi:hypothetical protein